MVNIGSFANVANANALVAKLRAQKLPVLADKVAIASGSAMRVRVGPYADRATAEAARLRAEEDHRHRRQGGGLRCRARALAKPRAARGAKPRRAAPSRAAPRRRRPSRPRQRRRRRLRRATVRAEC
jgi:hypothetical protein